MQTLGQDLRHWGSDSTSCSGNSHWWWPVDIALGASLRAALPITQIEQRFMGRTSAWLVDKVKKQAQESHEAVRVNAIKTSEQSGRSQCFREIWASPDRSASGDQQQASHLSFRSSGFSSDMLNLTRHR